MSIKPAFSLNLGSSTNPSPFWHKPKTKASNVNNVLKKIFKWLKLAIFAFFMVVGVWGCFQSMWDATIATDKEVGGGLEFGYLFGTTGDWRYDLSAAYGVHYNTFTDFTMQYGLFYGLFVWPCAKLVVAIMYPLRGMTGGLNALLAIFVLLFIIRALSIIVTLRSTLQNEKMTEVQGKISEINAKYKDSKDMASRQKKQREVMEIYAKHKIKPFAAMEQMFITLPIFMVVYRVVTTVRPIKASVLFGIWNFSYSPISEITGSFTDGGWTYVFFILLVIPLQILSMKLPQMWAKRRSRSATASTSKGGKQLKKTKMIQWVFMGVMAVMVVMSATGVGVYWFFNSLFSIGQAYLMHKIILRNRRKHGTLEAKLEKLGLE